MSDLSPTLERVRAYCEWLRSPASSEDAEADEAMPMSALETADTFDALLAALARLQEERDRFEAAYKSEYAKFQAETLVTDKLTRALKAMTYARKSWEREANAEAETVKEFRAEVSRLTTALQQAGKDGERYVTLREALFHRDSTEVGEAYFRMKVVGQCPSEDEFDAAIDELARAPRDGGTA